MIPENFIYFSLNLTDSSINKLSDFISKYYIIQEVIKGKEVTGNFLHHCTIFHKNDKYPSNEELKEIFYNKIKEEFEKEVDKIYKIKIIGWGYNNKALALLVNEKSIELPRLISHKYHITVCTFNGNKPVESNYISVWDIFDEPIEVDCVLFENILK